MNRAQFVATHAIACMILTVAFVVIALWINGGELPNDKGFRTMTFVIWALVVPLLTHAATCVVEWVWEDIEQ